MKKRLGIGILGCGDMGAIHAACYARQPGCQIIGFSNRTPEKAAALATKLGGQVFATPDELFHDPRIAAVSITTPQQFHAQAVVVAAHAGKHIFCEKPVGLTPEEMEAMSAALRSSGVVCMVGHQLRFHPVVRWARKEMPALGRVFHLELEMGFLIKSEAGRCWEDLHSGGFFMELGCHLADLARFLGGEVRHVSGHTLRLNPKRATEDFTHSLLQFETGAIGSILVSANHRGHRQGVLRGRILGENGRLEFSIYPYGRAFNESKLILDDGKDVFRPGETVRRLERTTLPPSSVEKYPGYFDVYDREIQSFLEAIEHQRTPPVTFSDGRKAVEIVLVTYAHQGIVTDAPNFRQQLEVYRNDEACHPLLKPGR